MSSNYERLLAEVCVFFDIGEPKHIAPGGGYANANFRVTTNKGKYFVKFALEHPAEALESEIAYVQHAASAALPCPTFLAGRAGQHVFAANDTHAVAMKLLQGKSHDILSDNQLATLGRVLAQVHTTDSGTLVPRTTWWRQHYLQDGIAVAQNRFGRTNEFQRIKECAANLKALNFAALPKGIVHGDPWPQNAVFSGQELLALVDWEETTIGYCIFDLVYLAMSCCFTDNALDAHQFGKLITAYESFRPLTIHERTSFVDVAQRIACITALWNLLRCDTGAEDLPTTMAWYNELDLAQLRLHV